QQQQQQQQNADSVAAPAVAVTGGVDFSQTHTGTILLSAALLDSTTYAALSCALMAMLMPAVTKFAARPLYCIGGCCGLGWRCGLLLLLLLLLGGVAIPEFTETFDRYLRAPQRYILQPLFSSIGFSIPFLELWTGEVIWKGVVYTLVMPLGKVIVGIVVPICDLVSSGRKMR
ncbi:hypothetical protein C8A03DRAFT_37573, partial [Achaetomium macrosporum]